MIKSTAEFLAFSGEPALLVKGGKILFANDAACALLGPELTQKSFASLFGGDVAGMQASSFVGEAEVGDRRVLLRIKTLEGIRVVFLSSCAPVEELVGDAFFYALRNELMQLGVSSELLRTRLNPGDGSAASALLGLRQSLYRVNRTLGNLSVIRGVERGSLLFHPQPIVMAALLEELIDSVRLSLPRPEILFRAAGDSLIRGDPALLESLALNLLSNCLRHAEGCTRIRVNLHSAGEQVILSVDDDGCGIPGDRLHTVMERYRFDGSLRELGHGPGLGLTAARNIARLHGGTLLLESREGAGTSVRVSLSRAPRTLTTLQTEAADYDRNYDTILTGLAGCLPPEAFDARDR